MITPWLAQAGNVWRNVLLSFKLYVHVFVMKNNQMYTNSYRIVWNEVHDYFIIPFDSIIIILSFALFHSSI